MGAPVLTATWKYAIAGGALALGAPLGLMALRLALAHDPSIDVLQEDLRNQASIYAYVTISTKVVFALFGAFTGYQAEQLKRLSRGDHLTGLLNRRALEVMMSEERERALRQGTTLAFVLLDIDGLKAINDREGHDRGDAAIRSVGDVLKDASRAADASARWGGDEFAVLAPSTDAKRGLALGERIRAQVEDLDCGVTISVGVATLRPADGEGSVEDLIQRADGALYRAKREGRNRVVGEAE